MTCPLKTDPKDKLGLEQKRAGRKPGKQFSSEQINTKLRESEVLSSQGMTVVEAARQLDISKQTYSCWHRDLEGMDTTQARILKELEKENLQLKKLVPALPVDNAILMEVLSKK